MAQDRGVARATSLPAPGRLKMLCKIKCGKLLGGVARRRAIVIALATFVAAAAFSGGSDEELPLGESGFPEFITSAENYYVTRIGDVPEIDGKSYTLEVKGLIGKPGEFDLDTLYGMSDTELPLTVECIGNSPNGALLSTAVWRGIPLYDFLKELGIDESATGVRYQAADGYYASHTLEQIRENGVLLALYMNGEPIPPLHGFPIRILNPGYYGVKQPAWVTSIEVIDRPLEDYWGDRGWDVSPPIAVDSKIFTPDENQSIGVGETLRLTGAAFGGERGRIAKVEVTSDGGDTWTEATIARRMDADNVWVFWEAEMSFPKSGSYVVNVRATDVSGVSQQEDDPDRYDGTNDWPIVRVNVR
jgi:DMSO/TMAO reductase YedYZ molybdopterin-dependent catalytic subunit